MVPGGAARAGGLAGARTSTSGATRTRSTRACRSSSPTPRTSNWTWDDTAGAYYWHRFFHHQPDLNFDNPRVLEAVVRVMHFWLDRGVDGMRLDAVPYLIEREGTPCANLDETHAILQARFAREMDARHTDRLLLAEANQWPADVRPVLRRRRRVPHGVPLPADAAHVHGGAAGGPPSDRRDPAPDAGHPRELPVGAVPPQPRRADARDGDRRRARLHVSGLRDRSADADQRRHPPAAGAADGEQPPPHRADEQPAVLAAGHAGDLLRRRDRHGRQHLPRRPQRGAHADAVDRRSQRRLLARRRRAAVRAAHHGSGLRLSPPSTSRRRSDRRSRCSTG